MMPYNCSFDALIFWTGWFETSIHWRISSSAFSGLDCCLSDVVVVRFTEKDAEILRLDYTNTRFSFIGWKTRCPRRRAEEWKTSFYEAGDQRICLTYCKHPTVNQTDWHIHVSYMRWILYQLWPIKMFLW